MAGESLSPFFKEGDYVIVLRRPFIFSRLKEGDIIIFRHPVYGQMIKKVEGISPDGLELFVVGSHPESTDSRHFGPIPNLWVSGKVIAHIPQPTQ